MPKRARRNASYIVLRLPWEVAPLFKDWLAAHFPDRADRVMSRVRDMRGGKDYDAHFATRMKGEGLWADMLKQRFHQAARRLGLNERRARHSGYVGCSSVSSRAAWSR